MKRSVDTPDFIGLTKTLFSWRSIWKSELPAAAIVTGS